MELLISDKSVLLLFYVTSLSNLFLLLMYIYIFRELFHLKLTFSYTLKTIEKLYPEFGTESDIEAVVNQSCKKV